MDSVQFTTAADLLSFQGVARFKAEGLSESRSPLSLQQRAWFEDADQVAVEFSRTPASFLLIGQPRPDLMEEALRQLRERHDILRTRYGWEGGAPYQAPAPDFDGPLLNLVDLSRLPDELHERGVHSILSDALHEKPDYERGRPLKCWLIRLDPQRHIFSAIIDHIALDNRSMEIILREFFVLYSDLVSGAEFRLSPQPLSYLQYALNTQDRFGAEAAERNLVRWLEELAGVTPVDLRDPAKAPYPDRSDIGYRPLRLPAEDQKAMFSEARLNGMTVSMLLACRFAQRFAQWGRTDKVLFALIVDDRDHRTADTAGSFIRAMPYFLDLSGEPSEAEVLERGRIAYLNAVDPARAIHARAIPCLTHVMLNTMSNLSAKEDVGTANGRRTSGGLDVRSYRPKPELMTTMDRDLQVYLTVDRQRIRGHIFVAEERVTLPSMGMSGAASS